VVRPLRGDHSRIYHRVIAGALRMTRHSSPAVNVDARPWTMPNAESQRIHGRLIGPDYPRRSIMARIFGSVK